MQFVDDRLYKIFKYVAFIFAIIVLIASVATLYVKPFEHIGKTASFDMISGSIALITIIYSLLLFNILYKKNTWLAAYIPYMFVALLIIYLSRLSGPFQPIYLGIWILLVLVSAIFGYYNTIGIVFLISIYFVMTVADPASGGVTFMSVGLLGGTIITGIASWLIWRKFYINRDNKTIAKLAGQLDISQAQSTVLIESITDGIIVIDNENKITLSNPAAAKMTGWSIKDALGVDAMLVIKLQLESGQELDESDNPLIKIASTHEPATALLRLVGKTNSFITISISVSPMFKHDSKTIVGFVAVLRDVSNERAEENRRAEFISTASHEMRTPVAAIEGYLQLALNEKVAKIDTKARSFLVKALDSSHHLGQLFQDLLTSAKAEDGRLVSHPKVVEIGGMLEKLTDGLRFTAEKKGLLLDYRIGATAQEANQSGGGKVIKPLYYAYVDPDRIQEVMTNLFDNAIKYSEEGKISVALTGNNEVVQFFIKDTGQGIPKEDIPHLFQKFYRVDNTATRTIGGTGLGLFISKRIIDIYKGRIWVESEQGKGSTFYINLPRLTSQKATEMQKNESTTTS